jgi:hypothetical protein
MSAEELQWGHGIIDKDKRLTIIQATYFIKSDISIDTKWIGISQSF